MESEGKKKVKTEGNMRFLVLQSFYVVFATAILYQLLPDPLFRFRGLFIFATILCLLFFTVALFSPYRRISEWGFKVMNSVLTVGIMLLAVSRLADGFADFGQKDLEHLFEQNIYFAKLLYFLICFLQPIALPLPEAVTILAGSSVFGSFYGFLIGFTGTILGIMTMFTLSRRIGIKLASKINERKLQKYKGYIQRGEVIALFVLFVFPVLPDEVICIGAGLTGVSKGKFFVVAFFSKLVTSLSLAYSVQLADHWKLSVTETVAASGFVLLILYLSGKAVQGIWEKGQE